MFSNTPVNVMEKVVFYIAACCIPISLALQNFSFVLLVLVSLAFSYKNFPAKLSQLSKNPFALLLALFFVWICVGLFYGNASQVWKYKLLGKHAFFIGFFIIAMACYQKPWSLFKHVLLAYVVGCLVVFVIAVVGDLQLLPSIHWFLHPAPYYAFFKIFGALFMAFGGFVALSLAIHQKNKHWRLFYVTAFLLISYNVLWMSLSRSGYVMYLLLLVVALLQIKSKLRWLLLGSFVACLLALSFTSANFVTGIGKIHQSISLFKQHDNRTSTGVRLQYVKNSLQLWQQKPIAGYGTGGFLKAYVSIDGITAMGDISTLQHPQSQPENTYTFVLVEHGLIGIILVLLMFASQAWQSFKLKNTLQRKIAQGFVVFVVFFGFANNLFYGNSQMIFYVFFSAVLFNKYNEGNRSSSS